MFTITSLIHCWWSFLKLVFLLNSIPGRYEAFWKEVDCVKQMWKNRKEMKVEDAGIAALFGLECFAWYCAGEIVGRGFTFTGYYPWNLKINWANWPLVRALPRDRNSIQDFVSPNSFWSCKVGVYNYTANNLLFPFQWSGLAWTL